MSHEPLLADRYELLESLGRGAFAHTSRAYDRESNRVVAVKILRADRAQDLKADELFQREAAVLRHLRHPGIPEVYDSFRATWEGTAVSCLVMEYVEGSPVEQMIADQVHQETAQIVDLFNQLLGILDYMHTRVPPVLHRDIKPANIIVRPDGTPVLVDFGAVRNVFLRDGESGSTIVGTYGYMPYEQYMGQAAPSSDLYSLAATYLHLLTGRPPADFMSEDGVIEVPPNLPGGDRLRAVIRRLLARSPAERYASAREAREGLFATELIPQLPSTRAAATRGAPMVGARLPPGPRAIEGETKELMNRVAYNAWRLMNTTTKPGDPISIPNVVLGVVISTICLGIPPMVLYAAARNRRRRLIAFFREGVPAMAVINEMTESEIAFGEKLARVSYEFTFDGRLLRDSFDVLPAIAKRWRSGDEIEILVLPDRDYDSVIISTA
jgi:serine/threonine protein kinase